VLELRGTSKRFGPDSRVGPIDLTLPPGRTTVLLGPSGCGKSTLLRLMVGLLRPDGGEVRFDDTPLTPDNVLELRRRMGYVVQDGGLFPHLTAADNVGLLAHYLRWPAARIEARVTELAALARLPPDCLARYPAQLSGGQRQRLGLMRALMLDPAVLLLDEPLGALDPVVRADLQADLREVFRSLGKTVVLVTHDLGEAAYLGDLIVLMRDGAVLQRGPLRELVEAPADPFVTRFIRAQRPPNLDGGDGA
jgi:osmoprotectant transport system ATP-binding protein